VLSGEADTYFIWLFFGCHQHDLSSFPGSTSVGACRLAVHGLIEALASERVPSLVCLLRCPARTVFDLPRDDEDGHGAGLRQSRGASC
jgi:hypothetical protein